MSEASDRTGRVIRVSGPIVEAEGLAAAGAFEVVRVGRKGFIGEVIKLAGDVATIQVYEYTGGLEPGAPVERTGSPLSAILAPGLLGSIFDGVQRPLTALADISGTYVQPGVHADPLDTERKWPFKPAVQKGAQLSAGQVFGNVQETELMDHRLQVPPGLSGKVVDIAAEGEYPITQVVCTLENETGTHELTMMQRWPMRRPRPFSRRRISTEILVTGQRVIDTFFPIARGGAGAIPGDFGTGKTILQQQLAKWSHADIVVYVGCGERGNEMTDILRTFPNLEDPRTGRSLMERTVLIANTSNMPVAAREVSIYTGITIAEYYRDMGYNVALMADSTSRWAEALREASSRLEEMPAEEGFPAYLAARLAEFYERAGLVETLSGEQGSVTVVGAVSPPGGDFSEPVTQHTTRFTRCFWALDRDLAYSRHYPAVGWLNSYSEYPGRRARLVGALLPRLVQRARGDDEHPERGGRAAADRQARRPRRAAGRTAPGAADGGDVQDRLPAAERAGRGGPLLPARKTGAAAGGLRRLLPPRPPGHPGRHSHRRHPRDGDRPDAAPRQVHRAQRR